MDVRKTREIAPEPSPQEVAEQEMLEFVDEITGSKSSLKAQRESLAWLAAIAPERAQEWAAAHGRSDWLAEITAAQEAEWDSAKHPRGGYPQNPGMFSPSGGSGEGGGSTIRLAQRPARGAAQQQKTSSQQMFANAAKSAANRGVPTAMITGLHDAGIKFERIDTPVSMGKYDPKTRTISLNKETYDRLAQGQQLESGHLATLYNEVFHAYMHQNVYSQPNTSQHWLIQAMKDENYYPIKDTPYNQGMALPEEAMSETMAGAVYRISHNTYWNQEVRDPGMPEEPHNIDAARYATDAGHYGLDDKGNPEVFHDIDQRLKKSNPQGYKKPSDNMSPELFNTTMWVLQNGAEDPKMEWPTSDRRDILSRNAKKWK